MSIQEKMLFESGLLNADASGEYGEFAARETLRLMDDLCKPGDNFEVID
jgi:hypothetical protein